MTPAELTAKVVHRRRFATELHLSPADYDSVRQALGRLERDPRRRVEHFVYEGMVVVRSFEP